MLPGKQIWNGYEFKFKSLALSQAILAHGKIATSARRPFENTEEYLDYLKIELMQNFVVSIQYVGTKGRINLLEPSLLEFSRSNWQHLLIIDFHV